MNVGLWVFFMRHDRLDDVDFHGCHMHLLNEESNIRGSWLELGGALHAVALRYKG